MNLVKSRDSGSTRCYLDDAYDSLLVTSQAIAEYEQTTVVQRTTFFRMP